MLLGLWVEDVDVVCRELQERDIVLLNGPVDRSWDKRTAACTDPAGAVWKIAQDMRERTAQRSGHRRKRAAARSVPSKARWNSRRRHCTRACAKAERGFPATAKGSGTTAFTAAAARACRAAVGDEGDGRAASHKGVEAPLPGPELPSCGVLQPWSG